MNNKLASHVDNTGLTEPIAPDQRSLLANGDLLLQQLAASQNVAMLVGALINEIVELRLAEINNSLLTEDEVARMLNASKRTVQSWRQTGLVPLPFVKIERGMVRYKLSRVRKFIDDREIAAGDSQ